MQCISKRTLENAKLGIWHTWKLKMPELMKVVFGNDFNNMQLVFCFFFSFPDQKFNCCLLAQESSNNTWKEKIHVHVRLWNGQFEQRENGTWQNTKCVEFQVPADCKWRSVSKIQQTIGQLQILQTCAKESTVCKKEPANVHTKCLNEHSLFSLMDMDPASWMQACTTWKKSCSKRKPIFLKSLKRCLKIRRMTHWQIFPWKNKNIHVHSKHKSLHPSKECFS